MNNKLNLDLLCVWPGRLSDSQLHLARQTFKALVLENHSFDEIVEIAFDYGKNHDVAMQQEFQGNVLSAEIKEYRRCIETHMIGLLRRPETFADGISFVAKNNIKIGSAYIPTHIDGFGGSLIFKNSFDEWLNPKDVNKFCQSKTAIYVLMMAAIKSDMVENVEYLLKIPKFSKEYCPEKVSSWLVNFKLPERSRIAEKYLQAKSGFNPKSYTEYANEMIALAGLKDNRDPVPSLPDFAKKAGHEVLRELMGRDSKEAIWVMQQLIRDGADWYLACEQKRTGGAAYFDLAHRDVDLIVELGKVMEGAKHHGWKSLGRALIEALGEQPFLTLAKDQKAANNLWKDWKLPFLVARVNERYREEVLATELGL